VLEVSRLADRWGQYQSKYSTCKCLEAQNRPVAANRTGKIGRFCDVSHL
jgi:hypothetical protein